MLRMEGRKQMDLGPKRIMELIIKFISVKDRKRALSFRKGI